MQRSHQAFSRLPVFGVGVTLAAVMLSFITLFAASEKPLLVVLMLAAMLGVSLLLAVRERKQLLLHCYIVMLPISIGKTLLTGGDYYWQTLTINAADLALLPYLLAVMLEWIMAPKKVVRPVGATAALFYVAWMWITGLMAENAFGGMLAAVTLTKPVLLYFILANEIRTPRALRNVVLAFGAGLLLQFPIVIMQWLTGTGLSLSGARTASIGQTVAVGDVAAFRPPGLTRHPNELADYPLFLLPTAVLLLCAPKGTASRLAKMAAFILLGAGGAILVISLSRGAWIAGAGSLAFTFFMARRRGLMRSRHVRLAITGAVMAVAAVAIVYPAAIKRATGDDQRSTQVRLAMFEQALLIFRSNPIAGVGLGGYYTAAKSYIPPSFGKYSPALRQGITGNVVHNKYLLVLAEHGIVGLIVLLAVYATFFREWYRRKHWLDTGRSLLALGLTAALLAQLMFYMFEHFYFGFRTDALWLTLGILAVVYRQENDAAHALALSGTRGDEMRPVSGMRSP